MKMAAKPVVRMAHGCILNLASTRVKRNCQLHNESGDRRLVLFIDVTIVAILRCAKFKYLMPHSPLFPRSPADVATSFLPVWTFEHLDYRKQERSLIAHLMSETTAVYRNNAKLAVGV